ncbi:MAG: peroxide stress protein YaaA [Faecalibacterium sp.]
MRIIISPAKKMKIDTDSFDVTPLLFAEKTARIQQTMQGMDDVALQKVWRCNDAIAATNITRLRTMDLTCNRTPAILAYDGLQYTRMAPDVFTDHAFDYLSEHLRILSGFYGMLRPFDGVVPYRLEMQAKLAVGDCKDIYAYWGDTIAQTLWGETDLVLNLASKEYSKVVTSFMAGYATPKRCVTCSFLEQTADKLAEKGTLCKMARGEMVRFLAEEQITDLAGVCQFNVLGFAFSPEYSDENRLVFIRNGNCCYSSKK